ncbi:hypothetical protein [Rugamonas apoptosis]|uniref:BACON domain-containing protein n=1 Tax=Rugamonas apoptosis TaxID=2758570 RepID=A0A7W2FBM1_9BURK|nr:hypothetical protein [Rugamonas apoptosis]MBA5688632.1 hypothetical protein [Rugamonas apoptosis]
MANHYIRVRALIAAAIASLALLGCGGGGSGGGSSNSGNPDPSPGFSVSIDHAELRFSGEEGGYIDGQAVLGSAQGTTTATVYTGALDLGTALDRVTQQVVGTQLKFTVYPKTNLLAGEYRGNVQLFACADDKCARHFAGSPVNVAYTITIRKGMSVSPTSMALGAISGATTSRELVVQLPAGVAAPAVSTAANWFTASYTSAGTVLITTKPMPPGSYAGTVSISIPGRTIEVPVSYTVQSDGSTQTNFTSDVDNLSFTATAGGNAGSRTVNVTLPSWTTELNAEIGYYTSSKGWLTLSKTGERSYTVSANAAELGAGTYAAQLVLRSGYLTSPLTLPVTMTVGAATWSVTGNTSFNVSATTDSAIQSSALQIDLPNLPAQGWTASSSASWLKLINSSGTTGSTKLQVKLDNAAMLQLPNASTYQADVTISSASGKVAATKVTFALKKNLPEVSFVAPHLQLPNTPGTLILRGRGFDSVTDLQKALMVSGSAQVAGITRINDSQLQVQVTGAASGNTSFSIGNAMGVNTGSATMKVAAPSAYTYKAVATAGIKGGIVYDEERRSVYTANKTLGTVMRFAYAGGSWNVTAASLPTIESVAMAPDGASLVATATSGKIVLFDPATLAEQGSYPVPEGVLRDNAYYPGGRIDGYNLNSSPTLVMANNGKAFFTGSGGNPEGGLAYFDLVDRKYGGVPYTTGNFYAASGPGLGISGDGSRLVFGYQSNDTSNAMQYLDTAGQVVKPNGAGIGYWYSSAQSLHGERLTNHYSVWDNRFSLIGNIVLPESFYARTSVFSPDGTRLYALAYAGGRQRIYVLDTSVKLVTSTDLPILGYIDVADAPTCNDNYCSAWPLGDISPDGQTLFFVGEANLLVVPVPRALSPVAARAPMQRAQQGAGAVPKMMTPLKLQPR